MNIAIIGAGGIAGVHSSAYESIDDVKVIAVVDIRRENAENIAKPHGARVYTNVDEMLENEEIHMADVCVPTFLHEEMAIKALNKKIHVLCEKPVALTLESAKRMQEAAEKNNVFLMIAHVIRFWPEYMYLKEIHDNRTYGDLKQASFSRLCQRPDWSWENWLHVPGRSGRAPLDFHIHDADFIYYLLGRPEAVRSMGKEEGGTISYISTQYFYKDLLITAEGGWYSSALPFDMCYRAVFEKAILDFRGGKLMLYPTEGEARVIDLKEDKKEVSKINITSAIGYYNEIIHFLGCIKENKPPQIIPIKESVDCLNMVLKEVESSRTGELIRL